jgi:hypothetical protein
MPVGAWKKTEKRSADMSMDKHIYLGFYFKCPKVEGINPYEIFPDESFFRIFDEGGAKSINNVHIYIPNKECSDCYHFSNYTETGLIDFETDSSLDTVVEKAREVLDHVYSGKVELKYGCIVYVN